MHVLESRPGAVYRSANLQRIGQLELAGSPNLSFRENLRIMASEMSLSLVWILEGITLFALVGVFFLLFETRGWSHVLALATTVSFLSIVACIGGYLVIVRTESGRTFS
jgi:hypothetical protein